MESKLDSITLKEHNVDSFPNFYSGECPDGPEWEDDLNCVLHDKPDSRKQWRKEFDNLIRYGPLDPQTYFIQDFYLLTAKSNLHFSESIYWRSHRQLTA